MSLTLHLHPLATFCMKVLVAFYENGAPFSTRLVDLGDAASAAAFKALWPIGKMPVLRDEARDRTIPESSIIIEYLEHHYPGGTGLLPADPELALQTRLQDRFYDLHVQEPMQKIVGDRIRADGQHDPHGVALARARLETACRMIDQDMKTRRWAMGEAFTMADCAAAPALFYADKLAPLAEGYPSAAKYLDRLRERPSFARALAGAQPYLDLFPR